MPLPLAMLARAAASSGGGSASTSGKIGKVNDMTAAYLSDARGALESAIMQVEGARTGWGEFIARVGASAPADKYGAALELGSENMSPRPYLRPAFDNKQKEIVAVIAEGMKAASKGGGGSFRDPNSGRFVGGGG